MSTTGASHTEGTLRPNLVVEFDNEHRFVFRVQCEVWLNKEGLANEVQASEAQAMELLKQLRSSDPVQLTKAQDTVLQIAQRNGASAISRRIIDAAFKACIKYPKGSPADGIVQPNLVVVFDNEYRFQFRVQCEVKLPNEGQALDLVKQLRSNDRDKLAQAQGTLLQIARDEGATAASRQIIDAAFKAVIEFLEKPPSPSPH